MFGFDRSGQLHNVRIPQLAEGASYAPAVKQVITTLGLEAFAFVSEGWMLSFHRSPHAEMRKGLLKTLEHPSRVEMLSITGIHPEYRENRRLRVEKDKTHSVVLTGRERRARGTAVVGAIADIIPLVEGEQAN